VGRQAKVFTANALAQPFTIYTRWRSVFGPTRYYAIVITSGGRDLNELLVRSGLARIYGTRTTLPDGRDSHEYLGNLHALENEAKAAKRHPVGYGAAVKEREIIADNLSEAGWSWGCVSSINFNGPTIWITDAHLDDGRRFIVHADNKLTAFWNWKERFVSAY